MEQVHPPPPATLSPTQSREGQGQGKETLAAPRTKAPTLQASLIHIKRDGNWFMPGEGNKAIWKNNKYFLSIYLFFF